MIMIIIIINTISSYIHMRLGNCLGSCNRHLKCHSAQAVSYKASQKLGNLTDYRVIGFSALFLSQYIVKLLNSACRMMVCITLFGNLESPRAAVNSSVSETKPSVETSSVNRRIV